MFAFFMATTILFSCRSLALPVPVQDSVQRPARQIDNGGYAFITSIAPKAGGLGTVLTLEGANLLDKQTEIKVGDAPCAMDIEASSSITVLCTIIAHTKGLRHVSLRNSLGTAAVASNVIFEGTDKPFISSIAPNTGGFGTLLTISGKNLIEGRTDINIGDVPCAIDIEASSSITVLCTVMGHINGLRHTDFALKNSLGQAETGSGVFFKGTDMPIISSIAPATGGYGTLLTIHGRNLIEGPTEIKVGDTPCAMDIEASSSITILCTVMGHLHGTRHVSLTNTLGTTEPVDFEGTDQPIISSIAPTTGGYGTILTISGRNIMDDKTEVKVGESPCDVDIDASSSITVLCKINTNIPVGHHQILLQTATLGMVQTDDILFEVKESEETRKEDGTGNRN
eukprot:m.336289 g.336289  ORF g.336289 m.336289 type:complete len:397 (-) comp17806_c0_seq1:139-1329(-)